MTRSAVLLTVALIVVVGLAAAVGIARFIFGLGVTTNLTDATPWGMWIGFDVMAGVALAGGGFVLTAIFYVLKREEFHPLVKPAVLTAFLGYVAVVVGLLFDLDLDLPRDLPNRLVNPRVSIAQGKIILQLRVVDAHSQTSWGSVFLLNYSHRRVLLPHVYRLQLLRLEIKSHQQ